METSRINETPRPNLDHTDIFCPHQLHTLAKKVSYSCMNSEFPLTKPGRVRGQRKSIIDAKCGEETRNKHAFPRCVIKEQIL